MMGKVSPNDRLPKNGRQKGRLKNVNNKYLKPGALAQLRYTKASAASKSCTDLGKKRIGIVNSKQRGSGDAKVLRSRNNNKSPVFLSPARFEISPISGQVDAFNRNKILYSPRTPCAKDCVSESRLESLPIDLLVSILCHLHHDQLKAVFHVSRKVRMAAVIAKQFYFNYTTPDRTRQEMLRTSAPLPTDHRPFLSKKSGKGIRLSSPNTPMAPKHGPRPPSRLRLADMSQITAVLFQDTSLSSKCLVPSVLPKPICKSLASNRVLFYEDELCQAVAQNKLL